MLFIVSVNTTLAQTTAFTYQGKLSDGANPANGNYDMQFNLFDTATVGTGTRQGPTITNSFVQVTAGIFTVQLDFGLGALSGPPRFLEISVRPTGSPDSYTVLSPRQPVTSAPYSVRSLNSSVADVLSSACVGCVTSTQVGSVSGSAVTGQIPVASVPAGSDNYVQNTSLEQAPANFNIRGNGTVGGTLSASTANITNTASANIFNATTQFNIGGSRAFTVSSFSQNVFAGANAGAASGIGGSNSFFGHGAGEVTASGGNNSFFGKSAGNANTASSNSFFGSEAGFGNTSGTRNSGFGLSAGRNNQTGNDNAFFGFRAGLNNTASFNSFFGSGAGGSTTEGANNSFFGYNAGSANLTGANNAFFGYNAGAANTAGLNAFFGALAGESNTSGTSNSFFGRSAGASNTTGDCNSFFGYNAGQANQTADGNSFFGRSAGASNTTGDGNAFFGYHSGDSNTTGFQNAYFGYNAGQANQTGYGNTFFGYQAGNLTNSIFGNNSFFGNNAGASNTNGFVNAFFGSSAGLSNTTGFANSFFGPDAGSQNTTGGFNSFFGQIAGSSNTTGADNSFFGRGAGLSNTTGSNNTIIGEVADVGSGNLTYATAIGSGSTVTTSNTIALGRNNGSDTVRIPGNLVVTGSVSKGGGSFKIDHPLDPENKTLSHSFVESPDMMNIYNGVIRLNRGGEAIVTLPDYFQALNQDFRYQLTALGAPGPRLYIAAKINNNRFKIAGGRPGAEVSWQVTGIRHDAYANAHRIEIEQVKPTNERGAYLHPDAFERTAAQHSTNARRKQRDSNLFYKEPLHR